MTTMTPTVSADRGPVCDHCQGSADGCAARQAARSGRCCRACTHGPTKTAAFAAHPKENQ